MPTRLAIFCDKLLEAGWLAALIVAPLFFNIYSSRVFEPDKISLVRSLALLMVAAWIVKQIEGGVRGSSPASADTTARSSLGELARAALSGTPLLLPTLVVVVVYLTATIFSLVPGISFWGSYQRLQGTYTTFSYIAISLIAATTLRTRAQLDRAISTAILTSFPIALYGIVQHFKLDPLPWGGDTTERVASNMGNSIFVAAYLIMVVPLALARWLETMARLTAGMGARALPIIAAALALVALGVLWILNFTWGVVVAAAILVLASAWASRIKASARDALLGATYTIVLAVQLVGIFFTQSRGPWLGLGGGLFVFVVLYALARGSRRVVLSAIGLAAIAIAFLTVFNLPRTPLDMLMRVPYVGRLGQLLETESGTGKVRELIWQGALQLISPHAPLWSPVTGDDPFNAIRPLVGYGPEAMYVAFNPFYPADLAHLEARNASPDRSHNETFDSLVMTGLLGFGAYILLFISVFYFGLKWLGVIRTAAERNAFLALWLAGGFVCALLFGLWRGWHFVGVALPAGMILGFFIFLVADVLRTPSRSFASETGENTGWRALWLSALVAALIAHFIEIHFGIAIVSTRLYFWFYAALLVILGMNRLSETVTAPGESAVSRADAPNESARSATFYELLQVDRRASQEVIEAVYRRLARRYHPDLNKSPYADKMMQELNHAYQILSDPQKRAEYDRWLFGPEGQTATEEKKTRRRKRQRRRSAERARAAASERGEEMPLAPVATWTAILTLILMTLAFELVVNQAGTANGLETVLRSLFVKGDHTSLGIFLVFALTLLVGVLMGVGEEWRSVRASASSLWIGIGISVVLALTVLLWFVALEAFWLTQPGDLTESFINVLRFYYIMLFLLAFGLAASLALQAMPRSTGDFLRSWEDGIVAAVLAVGVVLLVYTTNFGGVQADILYKAGTNYDGAGAWQSSIQAYKRALDLQPSQDFYALFLGRAYLEGARAAATPAQRAEMLRLSEQTLFNARQTNPFNTDHSANLARLNRVAAALVSDPAEKAARLSKSSEYYRDATRLSPNTAYLRNEWSQTYFQSGEWPQGLAQLEESLKIDREFPQTYFYLGEYYRTRHDGANAAKNYLEAIQRDPGALSEADGTPQAGPIGLLAQPDIAPNAIAAYREVIAKNPQSLAPRYALAELYRRGGQLDLARQTLEQAVQAAPNDYVVQLALVNFFSMTGQIDEAVNVMSRVMELLPPRTADYARFQEFNGHLQDLQRTIQTARNAPNDVNAHRNLAEIWKARLQVEFALPEYQAIARLTPNDYDAQKNLALLNLQTGHWEDAQRAIVVAAALAPDNEKSLWQNVQAALNAQKTQQLDAALKAAQAALALVGDADKPALQAYVVQLQEQIPNSP